MSSTQKLPAGQTRDLGGGLIDVYMAQLPVESAGRAILERACTTCHSLNGIEKYAYGSEDPYTELVSTMVSYGAILSDEEKTTLVQYLFATYGKR